MTHRIPYPRLMVALIGALLTLGIAPVLPIAASTPVGVNAREVAVTIDRSATIRLPLLASHVAVHSSGNPNAHVSIALSTDGTSFGPSMELETVDKRDARQTETFSGVIWTGGARAVRIASDVPIGHATVVAIDAHTSARSAPTSAYVAAAAVTQPD